MLTVPREIPDEEREKLRRVLEAEMLVTSDN
jgi:hypothetical protein